MNTKVMPRARMGRSGLPPTVYPRALFVLTRILRAGYPKMTADQAAKNALSIIQAMHRHGYQMGPLEVFEPLNDPVTLAPRDPFADFTDVMEMLEERSPWNSPELR